VAGVFHMITHAFFKALLFLCAGSVIHGLHQQQDMKRMGSLRKWMPITAVCFLIAWLAISGIPPFAGFWSKDDILAAAWHKNHILWAVGFVTAGLTAYYMSRQVALVFFGKERWHDAEHPDRHPHESPWQMWVPLVLLAGLCIVGGALNLPFKPFNLLDKWFEPLLGPYTAPSIATGTKVVLGVATTAIAVLGVIAGFVVWSRSETHDELEPAPLREAWYLDKAYAGIMGGPGEALATFNADVIDHRVIDGAVNGVGVAVREGGKQLRKLQTGYVRNYALGIAAGTIGVLAYVVARAR
jgi:NADH-quinone oxidoreductase subunit L